MWKMVELYIYISMLAVWVIFAIWELYVLVICVNYVYSAPCCMADAIDFICGAYMAYIPTYLHDTRESYSVTT